MKHYNEIRMLLSEELEHWSQKHFAELAFWRTIAAGVNTILSSLIALKIFGWI